MPTKIETLLDKFQGNAYPAMLENLAKHLGVKADSLTRLGLGWAPIVTFKQGENDQGWWVIPERDADAQPIGLSLRSQSDTKVMYPGSKHGLIYEVNPKHLQGEHGYMAGPHNWVRTMDSGHVCPVCGKPDGCLLSSENPAEPNAVICIRESAGAAKPLRLGYLHILKTEGILSTASPLTDNGGPVVIVEGATDTAAAMDIGFTAVGRPSNLACMDLLTDLLRARSVIIVGENDQKPNGRHPGKEGMIAAFQTLKNVCRDIKMVMPPETIKDLRAWVVKQRITAADFLEYVEKNGQEQVDSTIIQDDRPTTIARSFLSDCFRMAGRITLRRWHSEWYKYAGTKYRLLDEESFEQPIYQWAYNKLVQRETAKGTNLLPLKCDSGLVGNLGRAVAAETLITTEEAPVWINGVEGPNPKDLIVFGNGILDVGAFLGDRNDFLLDSTPDLFTVSALSIPFDPTATCPNWEAFLESSLGDEPAKIQLLQEWIGYCMTADTSLHKMMFFRGPTAAGKSVILNIISSLVGAEQSVATSFADLSGPFGISPLVGKLVCVIPDARTPRNSDNVRGLEILLNIVGEDALQVNRKFLLQLAKHRLSTRITIASNEFLDVPDHAGALIRRLNILEFARSFVGQEDFSLERKLQEELQGIAVWALTGLRRLREQGLFTIPTSSQHATREWRTATSPTAAFLEECTDENPKGEISKVELFDVWTGWSSERHVTPVSKSRFYERVKSNAAYAHSATYEDRGQKHSVIRGLTLKPWAVKQFLGRLR
jgi:putative DNA primase/helicase